MTIQQLVSEIVAAQAQYKSALFNLNGKGQIQALNRMAMAARTIKDDAETGMVELEQDMDSIRYEAAMGE